MSILHAARFKESGLLRELPEVPNLAEVRHPIFGTNKEIDKYYPPVIDNLYSF